MSKNMYFPSSYLVHHGIKGMRWGIRRYQNYDGTRIQNGGKVRLRDRDTKELRDSTNRMKLEKEYQDNKTGPAKEIARNTRDAAYSAKNTSRTIESLRSRSKKAQREKEARDAAVREKLKGMSDDELRTTINRIRMEREYSSLTSREVRSGWDTTRDVLDIVGGVASIAIAGAGIIGVFPLIHDDNTDYLAHHGIKGMKWGVRRYQNYDGTLKGHSNRHLRAAQASRRDAVNLKKNGYIKESEAVMKVAEKQQAKGELKVRKKLAKTKANKDRLKATKKDYKDAKKDWDKDFNAAYRSSNMPHITKKGRLKRDQKIAKAAVSLGRMSVAKGKYMQAKGVYKANDKMVLKGKRLVDISQNSNTYYSTLLKDVSSGSTIKQAQKTHETLANKTTSKELAIEEKYKKLNTK